MRLAPDDGLTAFRREFEEWLDEHQPDAGTIAHQYKQSSAHLPQWARDFQRAMFESGYLVPGWPPERGGRDVTPRDQIVCAAGMPGRVLLGGPSLQADSSGASPTVECGTDKKK